MPGPPAGRSGCNAYRPPGPPATIPRLVATPGLGMDSFPIRLPDVPPFLKMCFTKRSYFIGSDMNDLCVTMQYILRN